jgi:hypothetical protein
VLCFRVPQQLLRPASPQLRTSVFVCLRLYGDPHLAAERQAEETDADPRKELREHVRPSVRTYVSAELFCGDPQLRSCVTADARRSSGAAYMHGLQLVGNC